MTNIEHPIKSKWLIFEIWVRYVYQFQNPSFNLVNDLFDVTKKKSKDYYSLLVLKKARLPNLAQKFKSDLNLSDEALKNAFLLPHSATFEPYVKAFQYKVLNSILYTNSKLHKLVTFQAICVLSASRNQKHCSISFMIVHTQALFGKILSPIICLGQVNKYILIGKKF